MGERGSRKELGIGKASELLAQVIDVFGEEVTLREAERELGYPADLVHTQNEVDEIRGRLQRRERMRNYG